MRKKIEKKIGAKISNMEIIRESVDARKKPDLKFVYTVDFDCDRKLNLPLSDMKPYIQPKAKEKKNSNLYLNSWIISLLGQILCQNSLKQQSIYL